MKQVIKADKIKAHVTMNKHKNFSLSEHLSGLNTLPVIENSRSTGPLDAGICKYWQANLDCSGHSGDFPNRVAI